MVYEICEPKIRSKSIAGLEVMTLLGSAVQYFFQFIDNVKVSCILLRTTDNWTPSEIDNIDKWIPSQVTSRCRFIQPLIHIGLSVADWCNLDYSNHEKIAVLSASFSRNLVLLLDPMWSNGKDCIAIIFNITLIVLGFVADILVLLFAQ